MPRNGFVVRTGAHRIVPALAYGKARHFLPGYCAHKSIGQDPLMGTVIEDVSLAQMMGQLGWVPQCSDKIYRAGTRRPAYLLTPFYGYRFAVLLMMQP